MGRYKPDLGSTRPQRIFPNLITACPGMNAIALREKLIPSFETDAGPMPPGFSSFPLKDLRDMPITKCVDRAARCVSASNVLKYPET